MQVLPLIYSFPKLQSVSLPHTKGRGVSSHCASGLCLQPSVRGRTTRKQLLSHQNQQLKPGKKKRKNPTTWDLQRREPNSTLHRCRTSSCCAEPAGGCCQVKSPRPSPRGSGGVTPPQGSAGRAAPDQGAAPLPPFLARHCRCLATASPPHAVRPGRGSPATRTPPFISTENSSPRARAASAPAARRGPSRGSSGGTPPPPPAVPSGQGGKAPPPHPRVSFMARAHSPRRRPRFPPFYTTAPFPAAPAPPAPRPLAVAEGSIPSRPPPAVPSGRRRGRCAPSGEDVPSPGPMFLPRTAHRPAEAGLVPGIT